jgi:hypothetical protein
VDVSDDGHLVNLPYRRWHNRVPISGFNQDVEAVGDTRERRVGVTTRSFSGVRQRVMLSRGKVRWEHVHIPRDGGMGRPRLMLVQCSWAYYVETCQEKEDIQ